MYDPAILQCRKGKFGETVLDRLVGTGAIREDLGCNVGQIVGVGDKPFPASKEGQYTVCTLTVDKKPVISAGWGRNGEGAWSKIIDGEGRDSLVCKSISNLRLFTLVSENHR